MHITSTFLKLSILIACTTATFLNAHEQLHPDLSGMRPKFRAESANLNEKVDAVTEALAVIYEEHDGGEVMRAMEAYDSVLTGFTYNMHKTELEMYMGLRELSDKSKWVLRAVREYVGSQLMEASDKRRVHIGRITEQVNALEQQIKQVDSFLHSCPPGFRAAEVTWNAEY